MRNRGKNALTGGLAALAVLGLVSLWARTSAGSAGRSIGPPGPARRPFEDAAVPRSSQLAPFARAAGSRTVARADAEGGEGERTVRIRTVDEHRRALAGVGLTLHAEGGVVALGTTSDEGCLETSEDLTGFRLLTAIAPGYATRTRRVREWDTDEVTLVLPQESVLGGTVVGPEGEPLGGGHRVVAVEKGTERDARWSRQRYGAALHGAVRTDSRGRFTLRALHPGTEYLVFAAGGEYLTPAGTGPFRAGRSDAVVPAARLHGLALRLVDRSGRPRRISERHELRLSGLAAVDAWLELVEPDCFAYAVAGLGPPSPARGTVRAFYASYRDAADHADEEEPLARVSGILPGYAPFEARCAVRPVSRGLAEERVELLATAEGWGTLEVAFSEPPEEEALSYPGGILRLTGDDDAEHEFRVSPGSRRVQAIADVPVGRYAVSFVESGGRRRYPAPGHGRVSVEVTEGQPARFEVGSLPRPRNIEIEILDREGARYDGPVMISLARDDRPDGNADDDAEESVDQARFEMGPYVIEDPPPGHHVLFLFEPSRPGTPIPRRELDVPRRGTARVAFELATTLAVFE